MTKKKHRQDKPLHPGDKVSWKSHGSETTGEVEQEITSRTEATGRTVDASPEDPARAGTDGCSQRYRRTLIRTA
ncbi:hypervirulence associated TUDOR domain-containing protein [Peterkaempfera griseoplana]|uniref:DUF2945 domain-containing protein n=1 Tax=Peterkaempfera griseoplana TaxID=66896 RepID=UPI0006E446F5|nr:DUF2945 domain-containing protein [Peterkaempfera griseoplana]